MPIHTPEQTCAHLPRQVQPLSQGLLNLPCAVRGCPEGTDVEQLSMGLVDPALPAGNQPFHNVRVFNWARLETPGTSVWKAVQP